MHTRVLFFVAVFSLCGAGAARATSPAPFPAGLLVDAQREALHPDAKRTVGEWLDAVARDSRAGGGSLQVVAASGRGVSDFTITAPAIHKSLRVAWQGKQLTIEERCTRSDIGKMTSRCWVERGTGRGPIAWVRGNFSPREQQIPGGTVGFAGQQPAKYVGLRLFGKSILRQIGQ